MFIKRNIPNLITLLNLLTGMLGIIFVLQGMIKPAIYMVFLAGVFDFMDGQAAKILKAFSAMGKELDSLADIISFGVLPGVIFYSVFQSDHYPIIKPGEFFPWFGLFIPAFAAIRLAVFNTTSGSRNFFLGLPTPANAFMVSSAAWIYYSIESTAFIHALSLVIVMLSGSVLMVSRLQFISLKPEAGNSLKFWITTVLLLISIISLIVLGIKGIFPVILLYIFLSLIFRSEKN